MKTNTIFRLPLLVAVCGILILQSCEKRCNCSANYESTRKYFKGDLVTVNEGMGVTPGPWLQGGNDVWKECVEN
jgi:hypothetical protein